MPHIWRLPSLRAFREWASLAGGARSDRDGFAQPVALQRFVLNVEREVRDANLARFVGGRL